MAGRVRQPINIPALEEYINQHVPEIETPLEVKQFGFGQSNPTYQLTSMPTGQRYVMRKKPPGKLLSKTAHQVEREYRIIKALGRTEVPVPEAYCICEDEVVIGTPFYIMSFVDGRIFEDQSMPGVEPKARTELWRDAARTLAKFHRISYREVGLVNFGKSTGFYDRQLLTWQRICATQEQAVDVETKELVGKIPYFDELVTFFSDTALQPRERSTLVHGDYKIDNMVFHSSESRVIGILDWEMSTIGHPLSDLVNLCLAFYLVGVGPVANDAFLSNENPGLPNPKDIVSWYGEVAGWDPAPEMEWAVAFGVFRSSAIFQGIAARVARRQTSSETAKQFAAAFRPAGEKAWELVKRLKARREKPPSKL